MGQVNNERVGRALATLTEGLRPHVLDALQKAYPERWREVAAGSGRQAASSSEPHVDLLGLLNLVALHWSAVFRDRWPRVTRGYVTEMIDHRNRWAHQEAFSDAEVRRAEETSELLLRAIGAPVAAALQTAPPATPAFHRGVSGGFEEVWLRIRGCAGEEFRQRRGKPFTYEVDGPYVWPSTVEVSIHRSQFQKAYERRPLQSPSQLKDVFASAYVFAIMADPRIYEDQETQAQEK